VDRFLDNACIAHSADAGFNDCDLAPFMDVARNDVYTRTGNFSPPICDASNVVRGAWPDAATVRAMAKRVLDF
jgi:hypothetical protein